VPNVFFSRLEHSLNAGVHFLFFYEFSKRNLADSNLNLLPKFRVVGSIRTIASFAKSSGARSAMTPDAAEEAARRSRHAVQPSFITIVRDGRTSRLH
jgi:hypothetical protein